jgi:DNA-binding CsgD family transcriptional regulator
VVIPLRRGGDGRNNVDFGPSYSTYQQEDSVVLHITPGERDALELLAVDAPRSQIARRLGGSEADVERRLRSLFVRLGAATSADAVAAASRRGLLSSPSALRP